MRGPVSAQVTIRIAKGIEMVSIITTHSAKRLNLKNVDGAVAVVKAESVLTAID